MSEESSNLAEKTIYNPDVGDAKFDPIEGVEFIYCQHLRDGTEGREDVLQWIGDKYRVVLCPICARVCRDTATQNLNYLYQWGAEYEHQRKSAASAELEVTLKKIDALNLEIRKMEGPQPKPSFWRKLIFWK